MASSVVVTSRSTIMHAALAHLSDEMKTMDWLIIRQISMLPTEILLMIRIHLLLLVTDELITRSTSALRRYELTLSHLLCPECLAYNEEIYGQDIWQWEQFSGACACHVQPHIPNKFAPSVNPKQFTTRYDWLEHYLSRKSLRLFPRPHSAPQSSTIWDLVSSVLQDYSCEVNRLTTVGRSHCRKDNSRLVAVVPSLPLHIQSAGQMSATTLRRVDRDLALTSPYKDPVILATASLASKRNDLSCNRPGSLPHTILALKLMQSAAVVAAAPLALPLVLLTFFATVLCYYSKPCALKIM